jgi:hypothetical protein
MNKIFLVFIGLLLTSCGTVSATITIHDSEILSGSASGILGSDAVISVKNVEGLSCEGKMLVPVSSTHPADTEGTIECNDKRKGNFRANGNAESWAGEGTLDDGSTFFILIGPQKSASERSSTTQSIR